MCNLWHLNRLLPEMQAVLSDCLHLLYAGSPGSGLHRHNSLPIYRCYPVRIPGCSEYNIGDFPSHKLLFTACTTFSEKTKVLHSLIIKGIEAPQLNATDRNRTVLDNDKY